MKETYIRKYSIDPIAEFLRLLVGRGGERQRSDCCGFSSTEYFRIDEIDTIQSRLAKSYYRTSGLRVKFKFMGIYDPSETLMGPFEVHVYSTYLEIQVTHNFCHWQNLLTEGRGLGIQKMSHYPSLSYFEMQNVIF